MFQSKKIYKEVFFFSIPLILSMFTQQFYNVADTMIVGRFLGVNELAAVGNAGTMVMLLIVVSGGFEFASEIIFSRYYGKNDLKQIASGAVNVMSFAFVISILFMIIGFLFLPTIYQWIQLPQELIPLTNTYLFTYMLGVPFIYIYDISRAILTALGDSKHCFYFVLGSSCTNIILDLLFVCVFHFGIAGAAIATLIAQMAAALYCYDVLKKELPFTIHKESFSFDYPTMKGLIQIGTPLAFQNAIISAGGIVVQSVVNSFGFLFVAGFTATNKLYGLLEVAAISFGYAITTFNSQNLGAKQYERMKHGVFQANLLSLTTSLIISIMMLIFGKSILLLFISGSVHQIEVVLSIAFRYLSIMAICLPILYVLHTYRSALQGMENTFIPMLSGIVELIMRIGIALFLPLFIGQDGIYYAEVFAWSGAAILLYISYRVKIKAYFK